MSKIGIIYNQGYEGQCPECSGEFVVEDYDRHKRTVECPHCETVSPWNSINWVPRGWHWSCGECGEHHERGILWSHRGYGKAHCPECGTLNRLVVPV